MNADGELISTPLLTKAQTEFGLPQEAGLTGIAFHPDFNHVGTFGYGKFYTITTEASENNGGLADANVDFPFHNGPNNEEHQDVVREWDLSAFGNVPGNAANNQFTGTLANSRELLRVDQPGPFHNVVDLAFNTHAEPTDADYGLLYITSGDGGNRTGTTTARQRRKTWGPSLATCCGSIPTRRRTRSSGPAPTAGQPAYSIPADNPYNGDQRIRGDKNVVDARRNLGPRFSQPLADEFRSPDRRLYLGDVGENLWEEVDLVEKGKNYGWGHMEGTHDGTLIPGDGTSFPD